jgi:flagellar hook-associated protein 1 FlgK
MADLFSTLTSVARALDAQRYGLDVAGQNIANVNTPGYSRRVADLAAVAPDSPGSAGRGVDVVGIRALRDRLLEARLQRELPSERREAAIAQALSVVETALGQAGHTIDDGFTKFFDAFAKLADDPTSAVLRQEVVLQADGLASSFRTMASRFESARRDADRQIRGNVEEINSLTARIASLNTTMGSMPATQSSLHVRDEQALLVRQLSALANVHVLDRPEGGVDVSIGNGRPLVVGSSVYTVDVVSTPPSGYASLAVSGTTVTDKIAGGTLGGYLHVRDVAIPDYVARLDVIAYEAAQQVNALHAAGFDPNGVAGGDFFSFSPVIGSSVGAAAAMRLNPAIAADHTTIAAAGVALAGDNQTARAIAQLRDSLVLDSGSATLNDGWGQLVYRVGRDTRMAADERDNLADVVRQMDALRDEVSGVSLDEEAMHLLKFQRAYEANARFFNIIDQALQTLLGLGAR